jgi:hypothetical protein
VWRRIVLSSDTLLPDAARSFETAMGWKGYHLSEFQVGDVCFGGNEDEQMTEWVGSPFDPTTFDRAETNEALRPLGPRRRR